MATFLADERAAWKFLEENAQVTVLCADGTVFLADEGGGRARIEGGLRGLELLAAAYIVEDYGPEHFNTGEALSMLPAPVAVTTDDVVAELAAKHVVTTDAYEAQDLCAWGSTVSITKLDDVEALVGEKWLEETVEKAMDRMWYNGNGELKYSWDYRDMEYLTDDMEDIKAWLAHVDRHLDLEAEPLELDSFLTRRLSERTWFEDWTDTMDGRLTDTIIEGIGCRFEELRRSGEITPYVSLDLDDIRNEVKEAIVWERAHYDPDVESLLRHSPEVCVDLVLTQGDEWNSDFSNIVFLRDAQADPGDVSREALDDALANNGMSWLAEQLGLPRDCMLTAEGQDDPGHDFYAELLNAAGPAPVATVFAQLSLEEWSEAVLASKRGEPITLEGDRFYAGLFDPWAGGGSVLELGVGGPLTIPPENLYDLALEQRRTSKLISSKIRGYSAMDVYGTDELMWRRGSILSGESAQNTVSPEPPAPRRP